MVSRVFLSSSLVSSGMGHTWFNASTSQFTVANYSSQKGSCGGCSLDMFTGINDWAAVSASESMQIPYACDGAYQCATGDAQTKAGGTAGGCGQCFSVHTQGYNPYDAKLPQVQFYAAVVDSCANKWNSDWCPGKVGDTNQFGYEYHLNVLGADVDKLKIGDNPIVHFRPIECPANILSAMQKSCCDKWGDGIGCTSICPDNSCSAPTPSPTPAPEPATCDPVCSADRSCVVQADGYWAQCINCQEKVFHKECVYWGQALLDAAEGKCGMKCSKSPSESLVI